MTKNFALDEISLENWKIAWDRSQGDAKRNARFSNIAALISQGGTDAYSVLDLCCGPGDLGRAIKRKNPRAVVDRVDRDPFLLAICRELDADMGIECDTYLRDLWADDWWCGLKSTYQVIVASTALHWLSCERLLQTFSEIRGLLDPDGLFIFHEPVAYDPEITSRTRLREIIQNIRNNENDHWDRLWNDIESVTGKGYEQVLEKLPLEQSMIGDEGVSMAQYLNWLSQAGFRAADCVHLEDGVGTFVAVA